ncbi:MAG: DUF3880 domain-containing protein [Lachnospiraceae bacterium]|nr:DUF3880 domain-containing protein [Lachnospiraceae bacterium]
MDILFYRYGSICEPDYIESFQKLGFQVTQIQDEMTNKTILPSQTAQIVGKALKEHSYTMVFTINFFPTVSDVCNIFGIPYLCVIVDSPILELYYDSIKNPCNKIFFFDRALYEEFAPKNPQGCFHLPLAVNVERVHKVATHTTSTEREKYHADISFIGSFYTEKCAYHKLTLSDHTRGYFEGLMEAQLRIYGYNFLAETLSDEMLAKVKEENPDHFTFIEGMHVNERNWFANQYLSVKVAEWERRRLFPYLVRGLKDASIHVYTGSDTSEISGIQNRGLAKSLTEMPIIFHESTINLNPTARSIKTGLSQRVFDVCAAEGFLLTNYQEELSDSFVIGEEVEVYTSFEDLLSKCDHYLSHPADTKEIAHNAYEKVCRAHSYEIRIPQMLQLAFHL